ncbi:MAG TPA: VOC family protein [Mycobacteriales bacterium]|nr:VOC family protein [Mycobacteriales bacterium]
MAHRSRLTAVLVDVPEVDRDAAVAFWCAALGRPAQPADTLSEYTEFGQPVPGVAFMVQAVGDPAPRVHFDIETDDVDAEVRRLVALGATEVERIHSWVVMRDPAGVTFCVVRVQLPEAFESGATTWE